MAQLKLGSAGVTAREIDLSGPVSQEPVGVPAGVIGTSVKGPAFVPVTVGNVSDFYAKFGKTDGKKFGPLAVTEWLRNATSVTFLRVLGVGDGKKRITDGSTAGSVTGAGFTVGNIIPRQSDGALFGNEYANSGSNSVLGKTYFLGAFMSESAGSVVFSSAGLQGTGSVTPGVETAVPIVRGVLMAPSGVILRLSSSVGGDNSAPASTLVATDTLASGSILGAVTLFEGSVSKSEFVMLLNGHKGTNLLYPNVITASFDMTAPNYFANVFNKNPFNIESAGHYLYSYWDIHPTTAVVTGVGLVDALSGANASTAPRPGAETAAFLTTSSLGRDTGSSTIPNYEFWADRFTHAKTPWVTSQKFGGSPVNLFRFHAIDAGEGISTKYKISIENIVPPTVGSSDRYGTFSVVIRDINDNDGDKVPVESFNGLSLDPSSDRYIAKVIGDAHVYFDFDRSESEQAIVLEGNYPSNSNLFRVEMNSAIENDGVDESALPVGFRGIYHLVTSGSAPLASTSGSLQLTDATFIKRAVTPPLPMRKNVTAGSGDKLTVNADLYWGAQYEHVTSLTTPNASKLRNESLKSFAKYYPDFSTTLQNFVVGDNQGAVDTAANGIIDADRFCRNMFSLENIQVVTNSSGIADPDQWSLATYVRNTTIVADETAKTRAFKTTDLSDNANRKYAKFTLPVQGGFNGVTLFDRDENELNNNAVSADMNWSARGLDQGNNVRTYAKAIDVMKNTTNVDIQLLAIPGIRHPIITDTASDAVRERFDALYLMDIEEVDNNGDDVTSDSQLPSVKLTSDQLVNRSLDNNFAAAYFPDVAVTDPNTKTNLFVPPSVAVLGAIALNDSIGQPWFAPAGNKRGLLSTALETKVQLSKDNLDTLYNSNINPLVSFVGNSGGGGFNPKGNVVVWGQKTLQATASALDRVSVRRLLIDLRRQVRDIARTFIFEPNREATLQRFTDAVNPRLTRVKSLFGVSDYKVVIDTTTTTQADVDNNTIRGVIVLKPTKTIEFVTLDFVVSNNV